MHCGDATSTWGVRLSLFGSFSFRTISCHKESFIYICCKVVHLLTSINLFKVPISTIANFSKTTYTSSLLVVTQYHNYLASPTTAFLLGCLLLQVFHGLKYIHHIRFNLLPTRWNTCRFSAWCGQERNEGENL